MINTLGSGALASNSTTSEGTTVQYSLQFTDESQLPRYWYVGDTQTKTLQLLKKTYEYGSLIDTEDVTENATFSFWTSDDYKNVLDVSINNANVTFTAKEKGHCYASVYAYVDDSEDSVAFIDWNIDVYPLIEDSYYTENVEVLINQNKSWYIEGVYIKGNYTPLNITDIIMEDPTVVSVNESPQSGEHNSCYLKGKKVGTTKITVNYTVQNGENTISGSRTYKVSCKEYGFSCDYERNGYDLLKILPTEKTDYVFTVKKVTYDKNNYEHEEEFEDFTIETQLGQNSDKVIQSDISGNKVTITALAEGYGVIYVYIKHNGDTIWQNDFNYYISDKRYNFEYNGPTDLYPNQVVAGPTFNYYEYKDGKLDHKVLTDAVITCGDNDVVTYNDGKIIAGDRLGWDYVPFKCKYENKEYNLNLQILVAEPSISDVDLYEKETQVLTIFPVPPLGEGYSLQWTVENEEGEDSTEPLATIQANADGTATISAIKPGDILVTAVYKNGTEEIWRADKSIHINESYQGMELYNLNSTIFVNQIYSFYATDYRINSTYYDTTITSVSNSAPDIVEVLYHNTDNMSGENIHSICLKGKKSGDAIITLNYLYKDKAGKSVKGSETVKVTVVDANYQVYIAVDSYEGVPGGSIPLKLQVYKTWLDENGKTQGEYVDASALPVQYIVDNPSVATVQGNTLIFNSNAELGATVNVRPVVMINGKNVIPDDYYKEFQVVSSYYGLDEYSINIAQGESKTITPSLYLYDKDNPTGRKIENAEFSVSNKDSLQYCTVNGMTITGEQGGYENLYLDVSYLDEENNRQSVPDMSISVFVIPTVNQELELDKTETVSAPGKYFKIVPETDGIYVLTCKGDVYHRIELYDEQWMYISDSEVEDEDDYTVSISLKAGKTYWVYASIYWGEFKPYTITLSKSPKKISECTIKLSTNQFAYTGEIQVPTVTVKDGNTTLVEGTDYVVKREDSSGIGIYELKISGKGKYSGYVTKSYAITGVNLTDSMVKPYTTTFMYDGTEKKPEIVLKNGASTLKPGKDYILDYEDDCINIGDHVIKVYGKGNYRGELSIPFKIEDPSNIKFCNIVLSKESAVYTGKPIEKPTITIKDGNITLKEGTDYKVSYSGDFINVGTYTITINGIGNYSGTVTRKFTISRASKVTLTGNMVQLSQTTFVYTGDEKKSKPAISVTNGGITLKEGTDYKVSYSVGFPNAGKHTVTITGIGNYSGTVTKEFTINKASKVLAFTKTSIKKTYGDKAFTVALTKESIKNVQYSSSNTKVAKVDSKGAVTIVGAGKATITAVYAGDKNYNKATASYTLQVAKAGNSITASNVVKTSSDKKQSFDLKVKTKYKTTVSYSSNNKAVSVKSGKVTIAKNFVGKAIITIKAAATSNYNAATKTISITVNPAGTKLSSLKKKSKDKIAINWKKNTKVSGYEIQYSTDKNFKKATTIVIKKSGTTSYQASKLKTKKVYYVRVRTYKTVNKVKYYSGWSSVLKIKL